VLRLVRRSCQSGTERKPFVSLDLFCRAHRLFLSRSYPSVAPQLKHLHRLEPGHLQSRYSRSNPLDFTPQNMYQTRSSLSKIADRLRPSTSLADQAIVAAYTRIPIAHVEARRLANEAVFANGEGGPLVCWLELQSIVTPQGTMKGETSYNISNTRREVGAGVSAAAAPLASIGAFDTVFKKSSREWCMQAYADYLERTESINKLLAEIVVGLVTGMLPKDVLDALLLRRSSLFLSLLPPSRRFLMPSPASIDHSLGSLRDGVDNLFSLLHLLYPSLRFSPFPRP
jgi:hypothetical protein